MSAEDKLKEMEQIVDALTLKIVKTLATETFRGAYYAFIGDVVRQKLPGLLRSGKSDQEIVNELIKTLQQSSPQQQAVPQDLTEQIRRIISEELKKTPVAVTPYAPQPSPQAYAPGYQPQAVQSAPAVGEDVGKRLREVEEEISHKRNLLRILEERWVRGEISKEDYEEKRKKLENDLMDLEAKRQRLTALVPRGTI